MSRTATRPESTAALQRATARLSAWKSRIVDARNLTEELDASAKAVVEPFFQELKDRCDRAENKVLRLVQIGSAWQLARSAVDRSFLELEQAWMSIERVLRPSEAYSARKRT